MVLSYGPYGVSYYIQQIYYAFACNNVRCNVNYSDRLLSILVDHVLYSCIFSNIKNSIPSCLSIYEYHTKHKLGDWLMLYAN